jgi:hypothetical protein
MPYLDMAAAVTAPAPKAYEDNPASLRFFRDLVEPFGLTVDEELLRSGTQISHRDLLDELFRDDVPRGTAELVIVTHGLPDLLPFAVNAAHVNLMFGDHADCFAISEQGLAAPFTALRVIAAYQRSGRISRGVLVVLEQTTVPVPEPLIQQNKLIDSGVLLAFSGSGELGIEAVESCPSAEAGSRIAKLAARDPASTLVVTGPDGPDGEPGAAVHRAAPGSYCTSVWLELARNWREWVARYACIVLGDVDQRTGRGHVAVFRRAAGR